jgi:hypothetical protein
MSKLWAEAPGYANKSKMQCTTTLRRAELEDLGPRNASSWKGGGQGRAHVSGKRYMFGMGRKIRRMQRQWQWFRRSGRRLARGQRRGRRVRMNQRGASLIFALLTR